ncbi:hypothetical protein ABBQ38_015044 [Trebouxia sp. C0009 RCD-2024]
MYQGRYGMSQEVSHLLGNLHDMVHFLQIGVREGGALLEDALKPPALISQLFAPALPG